jgi:hypothetical protein
MPVLTITHSDLDALREVCLLVREKLPAADLKLFEELPLPTLSRADEEQAKHIACIAMVIEPNETGDEEYRRFLRGIYLQIDSLDMSGGEAESSVRWVSKKLTERLKKGFPHGHVTKNDLMFSRPIYFEDGSYKATKYTLTPLGKLVFEVLSAKGALNWPEALAPAA